MALSRQRSPRPPQRPMIALVNETIGSPWKLGARGPKAFDCWGLVCFAYLRRFGVALPGHGAAMSSAFAYANAFRTGVRELGSSLFRELGDEEVLADFDIILFGPTWGFLHCGLAVDHEHETSVLHCREGQGTVCEPVAGISLKTQFPSLNVYRLVGAQ